MNNAVSAPSVMPVDTAPSYRTVDNSLCAANVLDQRWKVYKVFFSP